jgi:hypothetical protein
LHASGGFNNECERAVAAHQPVSTLLTIALVKFVYSYDQLPRTAAVIGFKTVRENVCEFVWSWFVSLKT